jgi:formamidopyrimidine-DNA glycosylase
MPELPDIVVYVEALDERIAGEELERVRLASPFLLRTVEPPIAAVEGRRVLSTGRLGKRIVIGLEEELYLVLHLMIAGRLHWRKTGAPVARPRGLAAFDFANGSLVWTEAGSKKRASLAVVRGKTALAAHDPGGLEVLEAALPDFAERLRGETHTLKRALTDPHLLSGIGNAYSDEILHRARLSPFQRTTNLTDDEMARLFQATRSVLTEWTDRLRRERGDGFPEKVTAFREGMAVHGRYRQPCPVCGSPVQHILYAENEANYCATCQTGGKLLADRVLSQLLKGDWPRTLEELEARRAGRSNLSPGPGVD